MRKANPFEYDAANNLAPELIAEYYIEDHNYSRFLQSKRNVFLVGERGSGKTMTLLYNSLAVQRKKAQAEGVLRYPMDFVGVYIPCNTPLTHKQEYSLLDDFRASLISEHYLALAITYAIASTMAEVQGILTPGENKDLKEEMGFILGEPLPRAKFVFEAIKRFSQREIVKAQQAINSASPDAFYERAMSFSMIVVPLLNCLSSLPALSGSHFLLMLDDAHDLNPFQVRAMNSWIAYRDRSLFSFKVAAAKVGMPEFKTASGGSILEGHDFTLVDMEQPYQFEFSSFGQLAQKIVSKRLSRIDIDEDPNKFFPVSQQFEEDLRECEKIVRKRAEEKFREGTTKQIGDYVYKYKRAEYFRRRDPKANKPPFSGFETLVYLSTGVVRNLLEPCYWMFDAVLSSTGGHDSDSGIGLIPPEIQTEIILQQSQRKWELLKRLDQVVYGCSADDARRLLNLFDMLATLFRERLLYHDSEPRANSFTISGLDEGHIIKLMPLLNIARKAQLLYIRSGPAKDSGRREEYFVPNRMLWPVRGIDPVGQHARVSLKARDLWRATEGHKIPFERSSEPQRDLFSGGGVENEG